MNLNLISRYRQELMGLAMLMVVFHHLAIHGINDAIDFLHLNGGFGVDVFLLLSGMGLYYSTRNGMDLGRYFLKRLIRIFPLYFAITAVVSFLSGDSFVTWLLKATTIGSWTSGVMYDWYIPCIVILYLVFPLFHWVTYDRRHGTAIGLAIVILMYLGFQLLPYGSNFQMWMRWPVFFLGALLGKWMFCCPNNTAYGGNRLLLIICVAFTIGLGLSVWEYYAFAQPDLAPSVVPERKLNGWLFRPYFLMVLCFTWMAAWTVDFALMKRARKILAWVGAMSLEVYLLHGQFIVLARNISNEYGLSKPLTSGALVILSFFVAYGVHKVNVYVTGRLEKKIRNDML